MMDDKLWFKDLIEWVNTNGGYIHPSLILKQTTPSNRGIFTKENISKGTKLIHLPSKLVVSGETLPQSYLCNGESHDNKFKNDKNEAFRNASPWLRCIASFISLYSGEGNDKSIQQDDPKNIVVTPQEIDNISLGEKSKYFQPYLNSLPSEYDVLINSSSWSDEDIKTCLSGTSIQRMVENDRKCNLLHNRYDQTVKPYLSYVFGKELDMKDDYQVFELACACVSTRGFHLSSSASINIDQSNILANQSSKWNDKYNGPFLLPFIDMLNHTSSTTLKSTTLRRDDTDKSFVMIAERFIAKNEEILHSYGDSLSSAQQLQTFGFVEEDKVHRALQLSYTPDNGVGDDDSNKKLSSSSKAATQNKNVSITDSISDTISPAVISKIDIIQACCEVSKSDYPQKVRNILLAQQGDDGSDYDEQYDEVWDLPQDTQKRNDSTSDLIPDEFLFPYTQSLENDIRVDALLSSELITLCCIQFLPDEAYEELFESKKKNKKKKHKGNDDDQRGKATLHLLTKDVLEDYYLGKLVYKSIVTAVENKLNEYLPLHHDLDSVWYKQYSSFVGSNDCIDKSVKTSQNNNEVNDLDRKYIVQLLTARENHDSTNPTNENSSSNGNDSRSSSMKVEPSSIWLNHALYGLTIRIEEKSCLNLLRKLCCSLSSSLDYDLFAEGEEYDDDDYSDEDVYDSKPSAKQMKTQE